MIRGINKVLPKKRDRVLINRYRMAANQIKADMGPAAFIKFFEKLGIEAAANQSSVEYLAKVMFGYSSSPPYDFKIAHKTDLDVARELDPEFKRLTLDKIVEKVIGGEKRCSDFPYSYGLLDTNSLHYFSY